MADFTHTQGRYLAFIHAYIRLHGYPPAETEIAAALCVSPPSVNQMVKALEKRGLVLRQPGRPRSLQILVPEREIPPWGNRTAAKSSTIRSKTSGKAIPGQPPSRKGAAASSRPANLYVLWIFLQSGPVSKKFAKSVIRRDIEIRGDQTLADLHLAIFQSHDRWDQHLYEFQFGKRPFDPAGPNYGLPDSEQKTSNTGDARTTTLDHLALKSGRVFGYWFDFGDDWYHQIQVEKIEQAIPTVTYPRVIKRVGKSPPQYQDE